MTSADEILEAQRVTWSGLSAGWDKWDAIIVDQLRPVGAAMIERLGVADDQQHLDIACGTGEPGLSIAKLAPAGRVVLTDLVPEILDIAARRAASQGLANVETTVCSADETHPACIAAPHPATSALCTNAPGFATSPNGTSPSSS